MDEQKEENERAVYKSTLEEIAEKIIENISKENLQNRIKVKSGRSIGILTFKKANEYKTKKLYAISMVVDGKGADYIYDEDGDNIAWIEATGSVVTDKDIKLELQQEGNGGSGENNEEAEKRLLANFNSSKAFQNDNQGRYITDRKERIVLSYEDKREQKMKIEDKTELPNLAEIDVKIDSSVAIIDLYRTIYNGRRFSDVLGINQKLKDRLPNGINVEHLNYLTVVNSDQLTAKDLKKRESDVTCVIMDDPRNPEQIIELDSSILKPMDNISKLDQVEADKDSQILGDGKLKKGAETTTRNRNLATFRIVGSKSEGRGGDGISQPDDALTLDIRYNPKTIDESTSQRNDATDIEIYLGRLPANASQHSQKFKKDQNDNDNNFYQLVKLEDYKEVRAIDEISMQYLFRNDFGVKDEDENIKGVKPGEGKEETVRDANALNRQMAKEKQEHKKESNQQTENKSNTIANFAYQVNERTLAEDIINDDNNPFGLSDYKYISRQIKIAKAIMESNNEEVNYQTLRARVEQQIDQKTPGDSRRRAV